MKIGGILLAMVLFVCGPVMTKIIRDKALDMIILADYGNFQTSSLVSDVVFDKMEKFAQQSIK